MKSASLTQNSKKRISAWINDLGSLNDKDRVKARTLLERGGAAAVPSLIQALSNGNHGIRREAAQIFVQMRNPATASALVGALEDDDHDVRWTAMEALIALDRAGLEPLLQALMKDIDSFLLREGAHHVLHVLKDRGRLSTPMLAVFEALVGVGPRATVPWAAEAAWESLFGPKTSTRNE